MAPAHSALKRDLAMLKREQKTRAQIDNIIDRKLRGRSGVYWLKIIKEGPPGGDLPNWKIAFSPGIDGPNAVSRPFQMRVSDQFLKNVDRWRRKQPDKPSRAKAIRKLVEYAIVMAPQGKLPE